MNDDQYVPWTESVGIVCTKAEIRATDEAGSRGLFATESIAAGERILCVPRSAYLTTERLQRDGQAWRQDTASMLAAVSQTDERSRPVTLAEWEKTLVAMIEDVRRFALSTSSLLRDDDLLTLFLMAGRFLLREFGTAASIDEPSCTNEAPIESSQTHPFVSFLPHIAMLPQSFPTHTLFYSKELLSRLEGTNCHGYTLRLLEQMQTDFAAVRTTLVAYYVHQRKQSLDPSPQMDGSSRNRTEYRCLPELPELRLDKIVTLADYQWAMCNIYSRCTDFYIPKNGTDSIDYDQAMTDTATALPWQPAGHRNSQQSSTDPTVGVGSLYTHCRLLAPVFDMINHSFDATDVRHELDDEGNLSLFYGRPDCVDLPPLQPGDEICFSYGNFGNEKLLLVYGFTVADNPHDAVALFAPLSVTDPLYDAKLQLLETWGNVSNVNAPHTLQRPLNDEDSHETASVLPDSLLCVLRVMGLHSPDDIVTLARHQAESKVDDANGTSAIGIPIISTANERAALTALHDAVYAMSRRLALNLISEQGLQAACAVVAASLGVSHDTETAEPQATASLAFDASMEGVNAINIENAKTLCQSEFSILQATVDEIEERLEQLDA